MSLILGSSFFNVHFFLVVLLNLSSAAQKQSANDTKVAVTITPASIGRYPPFGVIANVGKDTAWRRRSLTRPAPSNWKVKVPGYAATDNRKDQARIHQDVREVDLVNTAQEVNDDCARCGRFGGAAYQPASKQAGYQDLDQGSIQA
jgi:hypothetical protein